MLPILRPSSEDAECICIRCDDENEADDKLINEDELDDDEDELDDDEDELDDDDDDDDEDELDDDDEDELNDER